MVEKFLERPRRKSRLQPLKRAITQVKLNKTQCLWLVGLVDLRNLAAVFRGMLLKSESRLLRFYARFVRGALESLVFLFR